MIADLDTLLTALYVELTDRIIPSRGLGRRGPGGPPEVSDAELACLAVAQVLLRFDDERHWLRAAPRLVGHAGYGYCPSHSRWYWGAKLLLMCTCDGTVTGFCLANPKLYGEREQARQMLQHQPANRPAPGTAVVTDKGLSGEDTEAFFASDELGLTLIRPARKDEKEPRSFPNWLRQRVEAIIWTLKNQLGLERHGGRVPAGLWARTVQRLLALNAAIWFNWQIGAPVKRSLTAYDHQP